MLCTVAARKGNCTHPLGQTILLVNEIFTDIKYIQLHSQCDVPIPQGITETFIWTPGLPLHWYDRTKRITVHTATA